MEISIFETYNNIKINRVSTSKLSRIFYYLMNALKIVASQRVELGTFVLYQNEYRYNGVCE